MQALRHERVPLGVAVWVQGAEQLVPKGEEGLLVVAELPVPGQWYGNAMHD